MNNQISSQHSQHSYDIQTYLKILKKPSRLRTLQDIEIIHSFFLNIPFFSNFLKKNEQKLFDQCCKFMCYQFSQKNKFVYKQGDIGDKFYVILEGQVSIMVNTTFGNQKILELKKGEFFGESVEQKKIIDLRNGESFGEVSLMTNQKRNASIFCEEDCHFVYLDKNTFNLIMREYSNKQISKEIQYLCQLPIFSQDWEASDIRYQVYQKSSRMIYNYGDIVYKQNDPVKHVYIIKQGEFSAFQYFNIEKDDNFLPHSKNIQEKQLQFKITQKYIDNQIFGDEELYYNKNIRQKGIKCNIGGSQVLAVPIEVYTNVILRKEYSKNFTNQMKNVKQQTREQQINNITNVINNYKQYMVQSNKQQNFKIKDLITEQIKQANQIASQDIQMKQLESRIIADNNSQLSKNFNSKYAQFFQDLKDQNQMTYQSISIKKEQLKRKMFSKIDENLYQVHLTDRQKSSSSIQQNQEKCKYQQKVQNNYMQCIKDTLTKYNVGQEKMDSIKQNMPNQIYIKMLQYKRPKKENQQFSRGNSQQSRQYLIKNPNNIEKVKTETNKTDVQSFNQSLSTHRNYKQNSQISDLIKSKQTFEYHSQMVYDKILNKFQKNTFNLYFQNGHEQRSDPYQNFTEFNYEKIKNLTKSTQTDKNFNKSQKLNGMPSQQKSYKIPPLSIPSRSLKKSQDSTPPLVSSPRNPLLQISTIQIENNKI